MVTDRLKIGTVEETMDRLSWGEYERWKLLIVQEHNEREAARSKK